MDDPSRHRERASEWPGRHGVRRAFARLANTTRDRKLDGVGMMATGLTTEERDVLRAAKLRLRDMRWGASADGAMGEIFATVLEDLDSELPSDWDRSETRRLMGLDPAASFHSSAGDDGRDYVIGH